VSTHEDRTRAEERFANGEPPPKPELKQLDLIDAADLSGIVPPKREWIVQDLLPKRTVVLLAGPGGSGKSRLVMQLGEALRRAEPFLGMATTPCTTLLYSCEDDADELHRRHARIEDGLGYAKDPPGRLLFAPRVGADNALVTFDLKTGLTSRTESFNILRATALAVGAKVVIIDTLAQCFAGNENDRIQVTSFVNVLAGLAQEIDGVVILLAHPPKNGAQFSGSTAWDGSVRARCLLEFKEVDGAPRRYFSLVKANYAKTFEHEVVVDDYGVTHLVDQVPPSMADKIDAYAALAKAKAVFLAALDRLTGQGLAISASRHARNYAPKAVIHANLHQGVGEKLLAEAMHALLNDGVIAANMIIGKKANRSALRGIGRVAQPVEEDEQDGVAEVAQ